MPDGISLSRMVYVKSEDERGKKHMENGHLFMIGLKLVKKKNKTHHIDNLQATLFKKQITNISTYLGTY